MPGVILGDLRRTARSLSRTPGFSVAAVLTLLLAVGVNSAVFSALETVLLRPVPVEGLDRVVQLETSLPGVVEHMPLAPAEVYDLRDRIDLFETVAGYRPQAVNLTGSGAPQRVTAISTVGSLFDVLHVRPLLGRLYDSDDVRTGNTHVVVLTYDFWQALTGGEHDVLGRALALNDSTYRVIGVLPPGFHYPQGVDLWTPHAFLSGLDDRSNRGSKLLTTLGRVRADVTIPQLQSQLSAEMQELSKQYPQYYAPPNAVKVTPEIIEMMPLRDAIAGQLQPVILLLVGAAAIILLIAVANIASLLLVRTTGRGREIAIRSALGGTRLSIVRHVALEAASLVVVGGTLGIAVGEVLLNLVQRLGVQQYPSLKYVAMDWRVLTASLCVTLVTGALFTIAPAARAARVDASDVLRASGRSSAGVRRSRFLRGAVVGQIALALVLLLCATTAIRSLDRLIRVDPGFQPEGVMRMRLALAGDRYKPRAARRAFHDELLTRIRALPGVSGAAAISATPFGHLTEQANSRMLVVPSTEQTGRRYVHTSIWITDGEYFRAMGIRLLTGRVFAPNDPHDSSAVILDSLLARELFGSQSAIGRRLSEDVGAPTVIGVVSSIKKADLTHPDQPSMYESAGKYGGLSDMTVVVRSAVPLSAEAPLLRAAVRDVDPSLPLFDLMTLGDGIAKSLGPRALGARVLGAFALLAALLAAFGIYGLLSSSTAERMREMGIRVALGARSVEVMGLVLRAGGRLTAIGLVIGIAVFIAVSRVLGAVVYGTSPRDPATILHGIALLAVVASFGCLFPALRAVRVDPIEVLRSE